MAREMLSVDYLHPDPHGDKAANAQYAEQQFWRVCQQLSLDSSSLIVGGFKVLKKHQAGLMGVERWVDFKHSAQGTDMNSYSHSLRQATIAAVAGSWDRVGLLKKTDDVKVLVATSLVHDIGEEMEGDIPYPIKRQNPRFYEMAETAAALEMIDQTTDVDPKTRDKLKESYWRVATSLGPHDIRALGWNKPSEFSPTPPWKTLRYLFDLYEKYGYASTGIQQLGLLPPNHPIDAEELFVLTTIGAGGQKDILQYLSNKPEASQTARILCHYRISGFPEIFEANSRGVMSAKVFTSEAEQIIKSAEMNLKLDGLSSTTIAALRNGVLGGQSI